MKRNKYLNTFDTTSEYENYIESALPEFPNVSLTKDDKKLHYVRTSPNDHVLYGEVVDPSQALPTISLNGTTNTPTLDTLTNMFYLDTWSNAAPTSISFDNKSNIKSIKKLKGLNTSNVTSMRQMFDSCSKLTSLDLSNWYTSNDTTNNSSMFYGCRSLKDVYITVEATLNKLTNNLTSQGNNYIPSSATIHYNGVDYKWQNGKWTKQTPSE